MSRLKTPLESEYKTYRPRQSAYHNHAMPSSYFSTSPANPRLVKAKVTRYACWRDALSLNEPRGFVLAALLRSDTLFMGCARPLTACTKEVMLSIDSSG